MNVWIVTGVLSGILAALLIACIIVGGRNDRDD